jgi:Cupin domain
MNTNHLRRLWALPYFGKSPKARDACEVFCGGDRSPVNPGSVVFVPGNVEHQVRNTGAGPLVVVAWYSHLHLRDKHSSWRSSVLQEAAL